ncbi:28S ribosomal protein S11, mitochondrial isoform X2 [Sphaerodactylus townsendi]|uniref:28S ribosomal protein S11, mitochondrial isoform X2 n=1 Tax=Sphaerodactylus townsendi TaxID=933632 RepID=UPI0020260F41|nr:28S ribosomal protein S11, mitochondrial isoform X2 [Sphaerodactylus townsendi]
MFALLAVVRRGLLVGDAGCSVALVRSVQTSLQKLQGLAENSGSQEADALEIQTKEDFSTHIHVVTHQNASLALVTCGTEGFKNAKKGTAIAAQTAAISAAAKAHAKGLSHVRVVVKGLGPGRLAAIKGLTMGGLEVVSLTDNTPIPHNGCRPRKVRRL